MKLFEYLIGGKKTGMRKRSGFAFKDVKEGDVLYLWNFSKKTGKLARRLSWEVNHVSKASTTIVPKGGVIDCQVLTTIPEEGRDLAHLYIMEPIIPKEDFNEDRHIWNTVKFNNIITTFGDEQRAEDLLRSQK